MNLVAADISREKNWDAQAVSRLEHHGLDCCEHARHWLLGMAKSFTFANTRGPNSLVAPTWLNKIYSWGPSPWPMPWCEAVSRQRIDCGVFSSFAKEIFSAQSFPSYSAQVIQLYSRQETLHLKARWESAGIKAKWVAENCVYHEVVAVCVGQLEIKIYDATDKLWLDPLKESGSGAVLSVRAELPGTYTWGPHTLRQDQWLDIA